MVVGGNMPQIESKQYICPEAHRDTNSSDMKTFRGGLATGGQQRADVRSGEQEGRHVDRAGVWGVEGGRIVVGGNMPQIESKQHRPKNQRKHA